MPEKNPVLCVNTQLSAGYDQPITGLLAAIKFQTNILHKLEDSCPWEHKSVVLPRCNWTMYSHSAIK